MSKLLAFSVAISLSAVAPVRAANEKRVREAVDRAVAYLIANYEFDQDALGWPGSFRGVRDRGMALCGIALIQGKIPADNPVIANMARIIREASIDEDRTVNLALDIIFLANVNDPRDVVLIQSMAVRLIMGQNRAGGWFNYVPTLDALETARMVRILRAVTNTKVDVPKGRPRLDPVIREYLEGKHINQIADSSDWDDNFNTMFATMAIWEARKYGIPGDALNRVQLR